MPYKDPERQWAHQKDYKRIRRAGEVTTPRLVALPPTFRLKTAADVLTLLSEQILAVPSDDESTALERARVTGPLASVALKAIEAGDLAARLEAVELAVRLRKDGRAAPTASPSTTTCCSRGSGRRWSWPRWRGRIDAELQRLRLSCPRKVYSRIDDDFLDLLTGTETIADKFLLLWLTASRAAYCAEAAMAITRRRLIEAT